MTFCALTTAVVLFCIFNPVEKASAVTNKPPYLSQSLLRSGNYDLTTLNIVLPENWRLDTSRKVQYSFIDDKGVERGWVISDRYTGNFKFHQRNHSTIINDEFIDIPLGKCRLYTLDVDDSTPGLGYTGGTHDDYYAVITLKDKAIYTFEFSLDDKEEQTKKMFINILENLSLKI